MRFRLLAVVLLFACASLRAQSADESAINAVVQKLFEGMAAHDAATMQSTMLPDARLYSARNDAPPTGTAADQFVSRVSTMSNRLLERLTGAPKILIHGRTAQVWSDYEFLLDGKLAHCGVDSFSLLKTADDWKIASIVYTAETSCSGNTESPEQAIRRVLDDQVQAWSHGDIDAFMNGYEDSPNTLFIGKTVQRGYDAVRSRYHAQYPTPEKMGKLTFSDLSVNLLDADNASVTGAFHLVRAASAGGNASGVFSLLFRRTPAGWKIVLDHTS